MSGDLTAGECGRIAGAAYVAQLGTHASDRRARAAFQALAMRTAPAGTLLLEFGAGPGLDARVYAERGYRVAAYDVDPAMCAFLRGHCADLMAAGRVQLIEGGYREFLARDALAPGSVELITANFAPLSLIGDLPELFARFYHLIRPAGQVLASVLNPYYLGDTRYGWWWRNLPRLLWNGQYAVAGTQAPVVRRSAAMLAAQAAPYFLLEAVYAGSASGATDAAPQPLSGPGAWLHLCGCRFMFVRFRRSA